MINKSFSNEEINFVLSLILGILFVYYIKLKENREVYKITEKEVKIQTFDKKIR